MGDNIKERAISGAVFGFGEKFSLQVFGFIQGVILARLLSPSDYGLIAMTGVFTGLSYTLIDSGFSTALIQKPNKTEKDYSTVFIVNVFMSFAIAAVLILSSNAIANFYNQPVLDLIIKAYAFQFILTSLVTIQDIRLSIMLEFKKKSLINILTTIVTGICAIVMAYFGFGVWSLVYPYFLEIIVKFLLYWKCQHWFPKMQFSKDSFKALFSFGSKILASSILATIFDNLYALIIGKFYSAKDLGYYSRGYGYSALPTKTITSVIDTIAYPILSRLQDEKTSMMAVFRKMLRLSAFVIFPIMLWLMALAKPLVVVLVTEKWLPCVVYLQLLCAASMWWHVHVLNLSLLKAIGRSDLFFYLEIAKKIITIAIICVTLPLGIKAMCVGSIVSALLSMTVNSFYTGKMFHYGILMQLKDMAPSLLYSISMAMVIFSCNFCVEGNFAKLLVGTIVGGAYFIIITKLTKSEDMKFIMSIINDKLKHTIGHGK